MRERRCHGNHWWSCREMSKGQKQRKDIALHRENLNHTAKDRNYIKPQTPGTFWCKAAPLRAKAAEIGFIGLLPESSAVPGDSENWMNDWFAFTTPKEMMFWYGNSRKKQKKTSSCDQGEDCMNVVWGCAILITLSLRRSELSGRRDLPHQGRVVRVFPLTPFTSFYRFRVFRVGIEGDGIFN